MSAIFGEKLTYTQENGPDVRLVVFGDEFYARRETEDGYTAVYDYARGVYCYAVVLNDQFVSSGVPISQAPPYGVRRHLREGKPVVTAKTRQRYRLMQVPAGETAWRPHANIDTFGPNNGLLEGRRVSEGSVRGLTVLVEFQDVATTITADQVSAMLNSDNYTANGNFCSVRKYYQTMSSGLLDYSNLVVGPINLSKSRSYYMQNLLVGEALEAVRSMGIDLSQFDSRGEGILDAVNFMYAGQTQYIGQLWPHNSYINIQIGNYRTYFYQLTSLGANAAGMSIGTFCHENGHMLCRFPDMYDYGDRGDEGDLVDSAGIGMYCLMGSGNHNGNGRTPSPVCTYLRHLVGWCTNEISLNDAGQFQAAHGAYDTAMIYRTVRDNEYFIVENRHRKGLDSALPGGGLAVYHCDILGSNEFQSANSSRHYQCALIQADGRRDLENNVNPGDDGDLFASVGGTALGHGTNPPSLLWDASESGLTLSDVSASAETINFAVGAEPINFAVDAVGPLARLRAKAKKAADV